MGIPLIQADGERLIEKLLTVAHAEATRADADRRDRVPGSPAHSLTAPEREALRYRLGAARRPVDLRGRLTADR